MDREGTAFWCHLCEIQFTSEKEPGVDIIVCPQCHHDFCELLHRNTEANKFKPYQKSPQRKVRDHNRVDRRAISISSNQLSQIMEVENERLQSCEMTPQLLVRLRSRATLQTQCVVCNEDIPKGEPCLLLSCQHVFHEQCLLLWLQRKNSCPTCRCKIGKSGREGGAEKENSC